MRCVCIYTMQEAIERLENYLGDKKAIIEECNGVVAGGAVLKALNNEPMQGDVDVYFDDAWAYDRFIKELGKTYRTQVIITDPYTNGFFMKNNILCRVDLWSMNCINMDAILCKNVMSCIDNFDISFCSVWYKNGVIGGNVEDALQKHGKLNKAYNMYLLQGNFHTVGRLSKYIKREYKITIDAMDTESCSKPPETQVDLLQMHVKKQMFQNINTFTVFGMTMEELHAFNPDEYVKAYSYARTYLHDKDCRCGRCEYSHRLGGRYIRWEERPENNE